MTEGAFSIKGILERAATERRLAEEARQVALKEASDLRKAVHNEQMKLRATGMNVIAVGFIISGIIGPFTNVATAITPTTVINDQSIVFMLVWLLVALILHCGAALVLRNLR